MKDVMVLIAVFAAGYVLTMGITIAMVKLFFPFKTADKSGGSTVHFVKSSRPANKNLARLRKVKLAHG